MATRKRRVARSAPQTLTRGEIVAKLNASAERTLDALMKAYEAGMKEGLAGEEEDQLIELMRRAKSLRETVRAITRRPPRSV